MKMKKAIIPALAIAAIATTSVIASACPSGAPAVKPGPAAHDTIKPESPKKHDDKIVADDSDEGGISANTLIAIEADSFEAAWNDMLETALLISGNQSKSISVDALRSFIANNPLSAFRPLADLLTDDSSASVAFNGEQIVISVEIPSLKTAFSALDKACTMTFTIDCTTMSEDKSLGCSLVFTVDGNSFSAKELIALAEQAFAAANTEVPANVAEMAKILADCEKTATFDSKKLDAVLKKMNKEYDHSETMPDSVKELTDAASYVWAFLNECVLSDSVNLNTKSFKKICKDMDNVTVSVADGNAVITASLKDDEKKSVLSYFEENTDALQTLADEAAAAGVADITGLSAYEEGKTLAKTGKYLVVSLPLNVLAGEENAFSLHVYRTYEFKGAKDGIKPEGPAKHTPPAPHGAAKDEHIKPVGPGAKNDKSLSSDACSDYAAFEEVTE